jgi:hypothetical protein
MKQDYGPLRRWRRLMPASNTGESGRPKGSMDKATSSPLARFVAFVRRTQCGERSTGRHLEALGGMPLDSASSAAPTYEEVGA